MTQIERDIAAGSKRISYLLWACVYWRSQVAAGRASAVRSLRNKQLRLVAIRSRGVI